MQPHDTAGSEHAQQRVCPGCGAAIIDRCWACHYAARRKRDEQADLRAEQADAHQAGEWDVERVTRRKGR